MFDFKQPDYIAELSRRKAILTGIRNDPDCLPQLRRFYKNNIAQFICDFGMTSDTRNADIGLPVVIPFVLFDRLLISM